MKPSVVLTTLITCLLITTAVSAETKGVMGLKRFAVIIGANDGGTERITLRYAGSDAISVAEVLQELGGVDTDNSMVLTDPARTDFYEALEVLKKRVTIAKEAGYRVEVFFYYSGHSDDRGLLLFGKRVPYSDIRDLIKSFHAEVVVTVLDSCYSGAMVRTKGGTRKAPFVVDASVQLKGHAVITSSAADEASQESDAIGGSFFTHYFVSGLRGAADTTADGKVSLTEAYRFAFNETLSRTQTTQSGAQHPNYDFSLTGTGDLVLTDLRSTGAGLVLGQELSGRLYIRNKQGFLVAETRKEPGEILELGLEPGEYRIIMDQNGEFFMAELTLAQHSYSQPIPADFKPVEGEFTIARGDRNPPEQYTDVPFNIGLLPSLDINRAYKAPIRNNFTLNLVFNQIEAVEGIALSLGGNWLKKDLTGAAAAYVFNYVKRDALGLTFSMIVNVTGRDTKGLQVGAFYNHTGRHFKGLQLGLASFTGGNTTGLQMSMVSISVGNVTGAQISMVNYTIDHATGFQLGIANVTVGNATGLQLGLAGVTMGDVTGAQIGLAQVNTGSLNGMLLGAFNLTVSSKDDVSNGAQMGVMNIHTGKINGLQLGVINYADEIQAPIGVLSIVRKGLLSGDFWASDASVISGGLRLGGSYVYNMFVAGLQATPKATTSCFGWGIGGHAPLAPGWSLDIDAIGYRYNHIDDFFKDAYLVRARLLVRWNVLEHMTVFVGPALNVVINRADRLRSDDILNIPTYGDTSWESDSGAHTWEMSWGPGLVAGVAAF